MKRLFKVFTLVFVLLCATLLTGCSKEDQFKTISNPATEADIIPFIFMAVYDLANYTIRKLMV
jgi:uncharacterized lipoprotein YajG